MNHHADEPHTHDVWLVAAPLGESRDPRPCVVVDVLADGTVELAVCSSQRDKYDPNRRRIYFAIRDDDPDFPDTGLDRSSYVIGSTLPKVRRALLKRRIGRLTGDLAERFADWI
jgi:hypothetical protein